MSVLMGSVLGSALVSMVVVDIVGGVRSEGCEDDLHLLPRATARGRRDRELAGRENRLSRLEH